MKITKIHDSILMNYSESDFDKMEKLMLLHLVGESKPLPPPESDECTHVSCYFGMDLHPCPELLKVRFLDKKRNFASMYGGTITGRIIRDA